MSYTHTIRSTNFFDAPPVRGLEFYLTLTENGEIQLTAEEKNGTKWYLLKLAHNGAISLATNLDTHLGLKVNHNGTIKINNDTY